MISYWEHLDDPTKLVPYCEGEGCDGVVKPDIIFFSESLPRDFFTKIVQVESDYYILILVLTELNWMKTCGLLDLLKLEIGESSDSYN